MMFVPSSYSHRFASEPHPFASRYPGAYTGDYGFLPDMSALMADLNSADSTLKSTLPQLKAAIGVIKRVKPRRGWGKSFRPRWLLWKQINDNALPKMVKAYKDMQSAQQKIQTIKSSLP